MRQPLPLLAALVFALGCGNVASAPPELGVSALTFTPASGKARIYMVEVEALADSSHFFKLWPKMGIITAQSGVELMDPAEVRRAVQGARMVPAMWPGEPIAPAP